MIYLKIKEDQTIEYPYSINKLKNDYPNTSFPQNITNNLLLEYNIYQVLEVSKGNDYGKNYIELTPVLIGGTYYQDWEIVDASQEEIEQRKNNKWSEIRSIRSQYLSSCDWTQLEDAPFDTSKKNDWKKYRQSLRDITKQLNPFAIDWPIEP